MTAQAVKAISGLWVDASTLLSTAVLSAVRAMGYVGVIRTLPLPNNPTDGDLSAGELQDALGVGLQVSAYQHVRAGLWLPDAHSGAADALSAIAWARNAGLPAGMHLYQDLESVGGSAIDTITYSTAWADTVIAAGYLAGLYVGFSVPCSPIQLYGLPHTSYWSDAGPREVAVRGFALHQRQPEILIAGVKFDPDVMAADLKGEVPVVAAA